MRPKRLRLARDTGLHDTNELRMAMLDVRLKRLRLTRDTGIHDTNELRMAILDRETKKPTSQWLEREFGQTNLQHSRQLI